MQLERRSGHACVLVGEVWQVPECRVVEYTKREKPVHVPWVKAGKESASRGAVHIGDRREEQTFIRVYVVHVG